MFWPFLPEQVVATTYGFGGWTRTPHGIDAAVDVFAKDGRKDVPQILIVVTDGEANGGGSLSGSSNVARYNNIYCFRRTKHNSRSKISFVVK